MTKILNPWRQVQKAIAFARKAHHGQLRKTGDPYLTHCIHTGRILAVLVPSSGKRVCNHLYNYFCQSLWHWACSVHFCNWSGWCIYIYMHTHTQYIYCDGHFILLVILISLCTLIEYNAMDFRQVFSTCWKFASAFILIVSFVVATSNPNCLSK